MELTTLLSLFKHTQKIIEFSSGDSVPEYTLYKNNRKVIFYYIDNKYRSIKYQRFDKIVELDTIEEALKYLGEKDPPFFL